MELHVKKTQATFGIDHGKCTQLLGVLILIVFTAHSGGGLVRAAGNALLRLVNLRVPNIVFSN